jgi:hypothetical protein
MKIQAYLTAAANWLVRSGFVQPGAVNGPITINGS